MADLRTQVQQYAIERGTTLTFTHARGDPIGELLQIADFHHSNLIAVGKTTDSPDNFAGLLGRYLLDNLEVPVIINVN